MAKKQDVLKVLLNEIKSKEKTGLSLRLRLFSFLMVLVFTMFTGIIAILLLTGTFSAGSKQNANLLANELSHVSQYVEKDFGEISVKAVDLAKNLSKDIEKLLAQNNIKANELKNHPKILEKIVNEEYTQLYFTLQKAKSSGIFIILDGTVNPALGNAKYSKAGFYIKNMEPNVLSYSSPTVIVLRGFSNIAREKSLSLHSQWTMEFDIENADYYNLPVEKSKFSKLPLSRLYYWSPAILLPDTSEEVMLCSVPLMTSDGTVIGVCGFEVSTMLFKLSYPLSNQTFNRMFCMLSPVNNDCFVPTKSLFSGEYKATSVDLSDSPMLINKEGNSTYTYKQADGIPFWGTHKLIKLYPEDSVFSTLNPILSVMVPKKDINAVTNTLNMNLLMLCLLLIIIGITFSWFISKKYIQPIIEGLNIIKSNDLTNAPKIFIPEIDDLIEFLSSSKEKSETSNEQLLEPHLYEEFVVNAKSLSPAERAVFNLYVDGHTAKEIAEILCLSINTIKTHNKRIYMKLNVASRKELLMYVNMLKEAGKEIAR